MLLTTLKKIPFHIWMPLSLLLIFVPAFILGPVYVFAALLISSFGFLLVFSFKAWRGQKDAMQKLQESKQLSYALTSIVENSDALIYVAVPVTGEIIFMNDRMKEHYNIKGDCVGQICYKVLQNGMNQMCDFCPCHQLNKDPKKAVVWEERSNVTKRVYRNTNKYIEWYNGKTVHIRYSVDITELAHAKELVEQNNHNKNLFLSRMSYEFRSPMNVILGTSEALQQDQTIPSKIRETFAVINNSAYLLLNIINSTLDLFKIESGKMELVTARYKISELLSDSIQFNLKQIEGKFIEFKLDVDEKMPLKLLGDEARVKQLLNNLLSNAFKHTEKGTVKMAIFAEKSENEDDNNVSLVFSISYSEDIMQEQIDKLGSYSVEDVDLAISIIKNLVNIMHGEITVKNEPGKNSTCIVRLPQKNIGSDVLGKEAAENLIRLTSKTFTKEYMPYGKVLVVDDVESNLYVVKELLLPYGLSVDTVSSGFEAIERIKADRIYDIVFMDHMMPKMGGIETVKIMREKFGYKHPIIALTASIISEQTRVFLDNGFDDIVSKPINVRQLDSILNRLIRNKQSPKVIANARRQKKDSIKTYKKSPEYLTIFLKDVKKARFELGQTLKNVSNASNEELQLFATNAHSMKGLLADIGENALSQMALALEEAGKQYDKEAISIKTYKFLDELRVVVAKIESELDEKNAF